jgi:nucleoside-diphosphate-sugar epimerase
MSILCITGGSGFIGKELVKRLLNSESCIRLVNTRNILNVGCLERFHADLSDPKISLECFLDGVDVIYNCAGEIVNIYAMRSLHVDGASRLVDAALDEYKRRNKPIHWVQLSIVGASGPPEDDAGKYRTIGESSEVRLCGEYEITKALSDDLVVQAAKNNPLFTLIILRPSNVIGQAMANQSLRSLITAVQNRLFFYIGGPSSIANYIHVNDVVSALVMCGDDPRANNKIFNLSNNCQLRTLIESITASLKWKPIKLYVPEVPLRILVSIFSRFISIPLRSSRIDALVNRTFYPTVFNRKNFRIYASIVHSRSDS